MFTGIIQHQGTIKEIASNKDLTELTIEASQIIPHKKIGDSIAIDGACLTITNKDKTTFTVQAVPETTDKTILRNYKIGTNVNLENPLKIGDSLDGSFVQGHIDFVGTILKIKSLENSKTIEIAFPSEMGKFFSMKGSVTINGVNLTISKLSEKSFGISIIPKTLELTNLNNLKEGQKINIEVDMISRYLDSLLNHKDKQISRDFLRERGFI